MLPILYLTSTLLLDSVSSAAVNPHPWIPAGPNDVRSPCPALNSLANHGFLPHSGKNMTVSILNNGILEGLNVGYDFTTLIGTLGTLSSPETPGSFDLDQLAQHNFPIEHDATLSRLDHYFGDDNPFTNNSWDQVLSSYGDATTITIPIAGAARYARLNHSKTRNPKLTYTPIQFILSYGETALYLSVLGDPITGNAPVSYVKDFFENERLPYELGWTAPAVTTSLLTLGSMIIELNLATGEELPEGLTLLNSTIESVLTAAFSGLSPV